MKINKNIIKELSNYLDEFNLTEIEYTEKDIKVKVSKSIGFSSTSVSKVSKEDTKIINNKKTQEINGTKVTSPIIGTAYLAPEPGGKKFAERGKKNKKR